MRIFYLIGMVGTAVLAAGSTPLAAAEFVVLNTGFRLHADRHELMADSVKIYQGSGFLEIPSASVTGYEPDPIASLTPVTPAAIVLSLPIPPVAEAQSIFSPQKLAGLAAEKYSLPESFVLSVMKAESNFRFSALSPKGAIGLMQLMESTARQLGVNPKNPQENAEGGARYLKELLARYERDPNQVILALAAYNAGPEAVERYHGVPPFRETREYILRVLRNWNQKAVQ